MILSPFSKTIVVPIFGSLACVKRSRQMIDKKSLLRMPLRLITYSVCSKTLSSRRLDIAMTLVKSIPLRSQRCPNQSTSFALHLSKSNCTAHEASQREILYLRITLASWSLMRIWKPLRDILASTKPMLASISIASLSIRVSQIWMSWKNNNESVARVAMV